MHEGWRTSCFGVIKQLLIEDRDVLGAQDILGWFGTGFLGQDSKAGLLKGLLGCLNLCPPSVRQLLSKDNNKNKTQNQLWMNHHDLVAHGTVELGFLALLPAVPDFPAVQGGLRGTTSSQCRMMSQAPWDKFQHTV